MCIYVKCVERNEIWEDGNRKRHKVQNSKKHEESGDDDVDGEKEEGTREKKHQQNTY